MSLSTPVMWELVGAIPFSSSGPGVSGGPQQSFFSAWGGTSQQPGSCS